MRRGLLLEASVSVILLGVTVWAVWQARAIIIYFGYVLLILAAVAIMTEIQRRWTKHEVIQNSHRGAYVQRHGRIIRLESIIPQGDRVDGVSRIPVSSVSQGQQYALLDDEEEDMPPWSSLLEPSSDEDQEFSSKEAVSAVLGEPGDSEINMALRLWKSGANSKRMLASSMTEASGRKVSEYKANQLIAELRRRGEL